MGLSNWERNQKIIWAVSNITKLGKQINEKEYPFENYIELKTQCDKLWYEMWGKGGNGLFWLFGADEEVKSDGESIWSMALYDKIKLCNIEEKKKEKEFEKSILDEFFSIPHILSTISARDGKVYEIYLWIQQIQYAVNRYQDELSEAYVGVMKICSKIYGLCFVIFNETTEFALAYILNKISILLYTNYNQYKPETWDEVTKFLISNHAHHDIRNPFKYGSYDKLREAKNLWKSLYEDNSLQNRMYCYLVISGNEFSHHWKKVLEIVSSNKWDEKKFVELKEQNIKNKKEKEEQNSKNWKEDKEFYVKEILSIEKD